MIDPDVYAAFEEGVTPNDGHAFNPRSLSANEIRRRARLLMKQVEPVLESLPDPSMTVGELLREISGGGSI